MPRAESVSLHRRGRGLVLARPPWWSYEQWHMYLARAEVETWVAYVSGTPTGYFELEMQEAGTSKSCTLASCRSSSVAV